MRCGLKRKAIARTVLAIAAADALTRAQNAGRGCVGDQHDFHGSRSRLGVKRLNRFLSNCFVASQLAVSTCVDGAGRASCKARIG